MLWTCSFPSFSKVASYSSSIINLDLLVHYYIMFLGESNGDLIKEVSGLITNEI